MVACRFSWVALSCVSCQRVLALTPLVTSLCRDQPWIISSLVLGPAEVAEWRGPCFLGASGFIDKICDPESLARKYSDLWIFKSFGSRFQWNDVSLMYPHPWLFLKPCFQGQILNFSIICHREKLRMAHILKYWFWKTHVRDSSKNWQNCKPVILNQGPFCPPGKIWQCPIHLCFWQWKGERGGATDF